VRKIGLTAALRDVALLCACLLPAAGATGVVLHDDDEQVPASSRPADAVVGRWVDNATCVAIGPNHVLTTTHQKYGVGATVVLGGVAYQAARIYNHVQADMRVVQIALGGADANLTDYVDIYTGTDEKLKIAVIGGCGMGRGDELTAGGVTYGYKCAGNHNETLRWGRNRIANTTYRSVAGHSADVLTATFDSGSVNYEASVGFYDSGAGWFLQDGTEWKLAGLTWTVELHYEAGHEGEAEYSQSWFIDPDYIDAIRLSSYGDWIDRMVAGPYPGDANGDGAVDVLDLTLFANHFGMTGKVNWADGDFNNDFVVDVRDLTVLANHFGWAEGGGGTAGAEFPGLDSVLAPEPASLSLLAAGVMTLLLRRRGPRRRRRV